MNNEYVPLEPHSYPFWIKLSAVFCFVVLCVFYTEIPHYRQLHQLMREAESQFYAGNFAESIDIYHILLQKMGSCKHLSMRLAQAYFACNEDAIGYEFIKDIPLTKKEWRSIIAYSSHYDEYVNT